MTREEATKLAERAAHSSSSAREIVEVLEVLGVLKFSPWTAPRSHPVPGCFVLPKAEGAPLSLDEAAQVFKGATTGIEFGAGAERQRYLGEICDDGARRLAMALLAGGYRLVRSSS